LEIPDSIAKIRKYFDGIVFSLWNLVNLYGGMPHLSDKATSPPANSLKYVFTVIEKKE